VSLPPFRSCDIAKSWRGHAPRASLEDFFGTADSHGGAACNGFTRAPSPQEFPHLISLKKYLDMQPDKIPSPDPAVNDLFLAILESYRALLLATGNSGVRACPSSGSDLQNALARLERPLFAKLSVSLVKETETQTEEQLRLWGECTAEYFQTKAKEVRELLLVLAHTAESMGERDQRYAGHFGELTSKLHDIADLEDLTEVRSTLMKQATDLKKYVDQMASESRDSVAQLETEVSTYEARLKAVEQLASQDSLTGIANRRNIEERIEWRIEHKGEFCVVILDLDRFKQVNDSYGHPVGDNLLQQFSQELRSNVRSTDLVGRWGGDEFVMVLDCDLNVARSQCDRVEKWVLGEYTIPAADGGQETKINVQASMGIAQWQSGETLQQLIARADSTMYRAKEQARGQNA
jgi:diguanylate cyclase (GGDEF)-like protein